MLFTCNQALKLYVNNVNLNVKLYVGLKLKLHLPKNCYSQRFHFLHSIHNKNAILKNSQEGARDLLCSVLHQGTCREQLPMWEGLGVGLSKSNSFAELHAKNRGQDGKYPGMKL